VRTVAATKAVLARHEMGAMWPQQGLVELSFLGATCWTAEEILGTHRQEQQKCTDISKQAFMMNYG